MKNLSFLLLLFAFYCPLSAQTTNHNQNNSTIPKSIYTIKSDVNHYDFTTVNKNLKLSSLSFSSIGNEDILMQNRSINIPFKNIETKSLLFLSDDFRDQQYNIFFENFLRKNEPLRWRSEWWWCPSDLQLPQPQN